jgi:hypothetical protein
MMWFEKCPCTIKSAKSHDPALINDIKTPAPIPAFQVTRIMGTI